MYPALYKLIEKGFISDYKKQIGKRLVRVYYHIESSGCERLKELVQDYCDTTNSIMNVLNHNFSTVESEEAKNE